MAVWPEAVCTAWKQRVQGHCPVKVLQLCLTPSHHRCFPTQLLNHSQLLYTDLLLFCNLLCSFYPSTCPRQATNI